MVIGSHQCTQRRALNLFFNDIALRQASTLKYLGVYIDQHLTWRCHVVQSLWQIINHLRPPTDNEWNGEGKGREAVVGTCGRVSMILP